VLNQGNEVTKAVTSERRLSLQVKLADRLAALQAQDMKAAAAASLENISGCPRRLCRCG
jgi:hypothetical protein